MKKTLAKLFARIRVNRNKKWVNNPVEAQQKTFQKLIKSGSKTLFGVDHKFQEIKKAERQQRAAERSKAAPDTESIAD